MKLLQRYVLSELLKIFLVALSVITAIMVLVGIYRVAHEQGLDFAQVLPLIPYLLPDALRFAIPGTILFAVCSVYGRLAASNELVAIKSLGISPWVVLWPTLVFTFFLSLLTVWINDLAGSWGHDGVQRIVIAEVEEIVYSMLRTQRNYTSRTFSINVKRLEGRTLIRPVISFSGSSDGPPVTIDSQEAEIRSDVDAGTLSFACTNGTVDVQGQVSVRFPDTRVWTMGLDEASRMAKSTSPAFLPMNVIPGEIVKYRQKVTRYEQELAAKAGFCLASGDFDGLIGGGLARTELNLREANDYLARLKVEPPRRWANGFSCLFFALLGAPVAVWLRFSDFLASFFACFLPILVVYYPLLMYGTSQAKRGTLPADCVWMGNLLLLVAGAWMLRRVFRY